MPSDIVIRRALLSVSDKTGLVEFARALAQRGVVLISTGGTAKALRDAGLRVTSVEDVTGAPEMMDGRVKTLHPRIHGGLLGVRDNPEHAAAMKAHGIEPIDLLVVNLYPFEQTVAKPGCTFDEAIENIDIGGPAMVRSAAKNFGYVGVVTRAELYSIVLDELNATGGSLHQATRLWLAQRAFEDIARYDRAIADWIITQGAGANTLSFDWPDQLRLHYVLAQSARYGENPHQRAAVYREPGGAPGTVLGASQLHGKELSYNNVADAAAAWSLACALRGTRPDHVGACVIKHANPCGASTAGSAHEAVDLAIAGDPLAAFGGILAVAGTIDEPTAARLTGKDTFLEVVVAEAIEPGALEMLMSKSANMRILEVGAGQRHESRAGKPPLAYRSIPGGLLVQDADVLPPAPESWRHAAGPVPRPHDVAAAAAIEVMVRAMNSNAVAIGGLVDAGATEHPRAVRLFGGGLGQVDRVTACRLAVEKAGRLANGAIAVSDAFFPFPDGPQILINAGVGMIVHPGGSKRDQQTLDLCAARGVTCMITGVRRFKH